MKKLVIAAVVVIAVGVGGVSYANHVATQEVKKEVDRQLALFNEQSGIKTSYESISASVLTESVELSKLTFSSPTDEPLATVQNLTFSGYEPEKIAAHTELSLQAFKFSGEFIKQLPDSANNKLAKASYDLNTIMDYDEKSGDTELAVSVNANDIADVNFDLGLAKATALMEASSEINKIQQSAGGQELTMQQQLQMQTLLMQAMSEIEPRNIRLAIDNQGQLKEVLQDALKAQDMTLEQMQGLVQQQLQMASVSKELRDAVTNFSTGLESFTVSASLPEGQTMNEINQQIMVLMGQPEKLAEFINLSAQGE